MWVKIITIKINKYLNYISLCALNLFNSQVSQFELNYWNKGTFPRHSNLLRCTNLLDVDSSRDQRRKQKFQITWKLTTPSCASSQEPSFLSMHVAKIKLIGSALGQVDSSKRVYSVSWSTSWHIPFSLKIWLCKICLFLCNVPFAGAQFARPFTSAA